MSSHLRTLAVCVRSCGAAAALLALAGCVLPPNVPAPEISPPAHYRAANDTSGVQQQLVWPAADWWQSFDSTELGRLVTQARQTNYDIAAAVARIAQADAQIRVAGAGLLPSLDAKASASRSRSHSTNRHDYQIGLNASYELDFWGRNRSTLTAAKRSALASRFDKATVALGVEASVASTYFNIVSLKRRLYIAEQNLDIARQLLKPIQAGLEVGIGTALDVARQKTQIASQQAAIPPIRQQLQQNINALAVLLGKAPAALDLNPVAPMDLAVPTISAGLPSTLLTRRPDIGRARARLMAARANVSASRAALFPSFDLSAQGGWGNTTINGLINPVNAFYTLAGNILQPIFEGGRLRGQLQVSRARYAELLANYQNSLLNAFKDVNNALVQVRQSAAREKRQLRVVALASQSLHIAQARLHQGITNITSMLDAERTLFNARDALVQSRLARLNAAVALFQALGGGWDKHIAIKQAKHPLPAATNETDPSKETQ